MGCPNDGARLVEIERSEILVDACPECREEEPRRGRRKQSFLEDLFDFD
jgi:Zn-finger nucleic acid-binding protein